MSNTIHWKDYNLPPINLYSLPPNITQETIIPPFHFMHLIKKNMQLIDLDFKIREYYDTIDRSLDET